MLVPELLFFQRRLPVALSKRVPLVLAEIDLAFARAHAALDSLVLRSTRLLRGSSRDHGVVGGFGSLLLGLARLALRVWHPLGN